MLGGNRTILWSSSDTYLTIQHQWLTRISSVHMNNGNLKIILDYLKCLLEKNKSKIYVALRFSSGFCTRVKDQASPDSAHIPWATKTTHYGFTDKIKGLVLQWLYLLPHSVHFETSEKNRPKRNITNTMYRSFLFKLFNIQAHHHIH